jgi:hypothetical protein
MGQTRSPPPSPQPSGTQLDEKSPSRTSAPGPALRSDPAHSEKALSGRIKQLIALQSSLAPARRCGLFQRAPQNVAAARERVLNLPLKPDPAPDNRTPPRRPRAYPTTCRIVNPPDLHPTIESSDRSRGPMANLWGLRVDGACNRTLWRPPANATPTPTHSRKT